MVGRGLGDPSSAGRVCRDRALGIVLGAAADAVFADPARLHPVAGLGTVAGRLERVFHPSGAPPADSGRRGARLRGFAFTTVVVGGAASGVYLVDRLSAGRSVARVVTTALTVWSCLGGTSLLRVASRHADLLAVSDVPASRELLPWLCGRDPSALDEAQLTRAVIESVAENTSDAVVATLFWAAVGGAPAAAAHRAANTLDAMVGHRSPRYEEFGWASARLDDVLGWPAARLAGALTIVLAPTVGGSPAGGVRAWHRDAGRHPSPNAGVVESAAAGALGVRLGGTTTYSYGVDERPAMGDGPAPVPADIGRAVRLMRTVHVGAVVVAAAIGAVRGGA